MLLWTGKKTQWSKTDVELRIANKLKMFAFYGGCTIEWQINFYRISWIATETHKYRLLNKIRLIYNVERACFILSLHISSRCFDAEKEVINWLKWMIEAPRDERMIWIPFPCIIACVIQSAILVLFQFVNQQALCRVWAEII